MKKTALIVSVVLVAVMLMLYGCDGNTSVTPGVSNTPQGITTPFNGSVDEPDITPSVTPSETPTATPTVTPTPTTKPTAPPPEQQPDDSVDIGPNTPINVPHQDYTLKYFLEVDLNNQCVNVYNLYTEVMLPDGSIEKTVFETPQLVDRFICSSGLDNSTPVGVFYIPKAGEKGYSTTKFVWGYFNKYDCWARYLTRIDGSILFHSIVYDKQNVKTARTGSYYNLGKKASHGCIRLTPEHAKWIHDNCPIGTMVSITDKQPTSKELKNYLKDHLPKYGTPITPRPNMEGTAAPTYQVTGTPEVTPNITVTSTAAPTATPTVKPTATPTAKPTATPTVEPTVEPTAEPTVEPTEEPTAIPTAEPTAAVTEEPDPTTSPESNG